MSFFGGFSYEYSLILKVLGPVLVTWSLRMFFLKGFLGVQGMFENIFLVSCYNSARLLEKRFEEDVLVIFEGFGGLYDLVGG